MKNRVFKETDLAFGKSITYKLTTDNMHIYRLTGFNQIAEILNTGEVRPKQGKVVGGHIDEVFWSVGGQKQFYYDKRPVLEVSSSKLHDGDENYVTIADLSGIYIFNDILNKYENKIELFRNIHEYLKEKNKIINKEALLEIINEEVQNTKTDTKGKIL